MWFKLLCVVMIISVSVCDDGDDDYTDSVINMLLNGGSREFDKTDAVDDGLEPILTGGIWKCGNCDNIDDSKLVYTEVTEVDDNMMTDKSVDIQIGFTLPEMQCITVQSAKAGIVRRVAGSCTSGTLTLSVASAAEFTIQIYN